MKLIKLTNIKDNSAIYINPNQIGHIYDAPETVQYGRVDTPAHTRVAVTTHNNGGFKVKESIEEIILLINN